MYNKLLYCKKFNNLASIYIFKGGFMMTMKFKRILPVVVIIITLIAASGFLTGFQSTSALLKQESSLIYADLEDEGEETEENEESSIFICMSCGYEYLDTDFDLLPDDWVCPVCGGPKSGFESDDERKYSDPLEWLAHLEHVLAMRSKHLAVLQRVAEKHLLKNNPAVFSIYGAIESSSKSVLKAQAAVDDFKEYIAGLSDENNNNEQNLNQEYSGSNVSIDENGNENKNKEQGNNKNNGNNGNGQDKNKANSSGKNKNK